VIFIPGLAGHSGEFDALARQWASGPVLRLHPFAGGDLSIAGQARQVTARAADAGLDRFVVVGHSQGGLVALELAASRPDLVAGVAILDAPVLVPRPLRPVLRLFAALLGTPAGPALLRAFFRATFVEADPSEHRDAVLARLAAVPPSVARRIVAAAFGYDGAAALDAVRVPATYVRANIPTRLSRMPAHVRGCAISGAGHWVHVHQPQQVSRELETLAATAITARTSPVPHHPEIPSA
jgi:pimeloyl-ACP methyl ester carboxylesterase